MFTQTAQPLPLGKPRELPLCACDLMSVFITCVWQRLMADPQCEKPLPMVLPLSRRAIVFSHFLIFIGHYQALTLASVVVRSAWDTT